MTEGPAEGGVSGGVPGGVRQLTDARQQTGAPGGYPPGWPPLPPRPKRRRWVWVVGVLLLLFLSFSLLMNLGLLAALGLHIGGAGGLREELVSGDPTAADKIALVNLKGVIADTVASFPTSGAFRSTADELEQAARDAAVKAVVLLVDSPGGEVTASDILCRKVRRFREETKKPVVAIFGSVAASGAYYVSVAADRIIAHPTTVTGSIGVLMTMLNAQGLMEKVGLRSVVLKSAPFKDIGSPFREMTPEEQAVLQGVVDSLFRRFKRIVAEGRKMSAEKVDSLADGRIFTADEALAAGLIDRIGYEEDAIAEARQLAHVPQAKVVRYRRTFRLGDLLSGELASLGSARTVTVDVPGLGGPRTARFLYMWLLSGEGLRETP